MLQTRVNLGSSAFCSMIQGWFMRMIVRVHSRIWFKNQILPQWSLLHASWHAWSSAWSSLPWRWRASSYNETMPWRQSSQPHRWSLRKPCLDLRLGTCKHPNFTGFLVAYGCLKIGYPYPIKERERERERPEIRWWIGCRLLPTQMVWVDHSFRHTHVGSGGHSTRSDLRHMSLASLRRARFCWDLA